MLWSTTGRLELELIQGRLSETRMSDRMRVLASERFRVLASERFKEMVGRAEKIRKPSP